VSARDSGKTPLEAVLGEVVVTAEKLQWLLSNGERVLAPSKRGAGVMVRSLGATGDTASAALLWVPALCCAVLCCAVLCCAVLCCAVLCCAVLTGAGVWVVGSWLRC
jgi:hypothetical protein